MRRLVGYAVVAALLAFCLVGLGWVYLAPASYPVPGSRVELEPRVTPSPARLPVTRGPAVQSSVTEQLGTARPRS